MAWKKIDPKTGKTLYIQGGGGMYFLSSRKDGALDRIPDGWKITTRKDGSIKLVPKN